MKVVLRKYGNSTEMALPPGLLKNLGSKAGLVMTIDATPEGRMSFTPVRGTCETNRSMRPKGRTTG